MNGVCEIMSVAVSPFYLIFGILKIILVVGAIPAIIYGLYLLRKIAKKWLYNLIKELSYLAWIKPFLREAYFFILLKELSIIYRSS